MTPADSPKKANPQDKRILVVDDDDGILQMVKNTLELEGFQVFTGRDGRNILQKAQGCKADLIITDLMMPGGGGYEVIRTLQMDEVTRKTPVLIMSGRNIDNSTKKMMEQEPNVTGYLEKPIRPVDFMFQVHKILNTLSKDEKMIAERHDASKGEIIKGFDEIF